MRAKFNRVFAVILLAAALTGCGGDAADADACLSYVVTAIDYSQGLDSDGNIAGTEASEYVTLPDDWNCILVQEAYSEPDDAEIDNAMSNLLYGYRTEVHETGDREIVTGDEVNIDFTGYLNGKAIEHADTNGEGTRVTAGGSGYVDGFLTQLVGHKPGDVFDISVTYPEDYENDRSLAGREATFSIRINYIVTYETPELTDEFVLENLYPDYGCATVDEVRSLLAEGWRREKLSSYFTDYLEENSFCETLPEDYVRIQMLRACRRAINSALDSGYTLDAFLQQSGADTLEALLESYRDQAEDNTLAYLIVQAVAEKAKITVTEDELKDYTDLVDSYGNGYVARLLMQDKVQNYLMDGAVYVQ